MSRSHTISLLVLSFLFGTFPEVRGSDADIRNCTGSAETLEVFPSRAPDSNYQAYSLINDHHVQTIIKVSLEILAIFLLMRLSAFGICCKNVHCNSDYNPNLKRTRTKPPTENEMSQELCDIFGQVWMHQSVLLESNSVRAVDFLRCYGHGF